MGVVAIHALGMAWHAHARFRKRIVRRIGVFRSIMRRGREQYRMLVGLAKKLCFEIEVGYRAIMALETNIFFELFHEALRNLRCMRAVTALAPVISHARIAGVCTLV